MKTLYSDLLLHVPHSSTSLPAEYFYTQNPFAPGYQELINRSRDLVDYYTDQLFVPAQPGGRIHAIVAPLCRTLCDMERLPDDPLEKRHLGILYGSPATRRSIFGISEQADAKLRQLYTAYQISAASKLCELESPLLIDCHSFSEYSTQLCEIGFEESCIDICLGFNEDASKPDDETIQMVIGYFMDRGYTVGVNFPFSNAKTFCTGNHRYHSLMIEVNKRLYMDERTLSKAEGFARLRSDLQELYPLLC